MTLISVLIHIVITANRSPVVIIWKVSIGDRLGISIFVHVLLSLIKGCLESGTLAELGLSSA